MTKQTSNLGDDVIEVTDTAQVATLDRGFNEAFVKGKVD